jgi:hypothetical protein
MIHRYSSRTFLITSSQPSVAALRRNWTGQLFRIAKISSRCLMASMPSLNTFAGIGLATVPSLWSGDQLPVTTVAPPRSRLRYREAVCIATPRRLNGQANSSHQDVDAKGARQVRASDVRRFALSTSVAAASSMPTTPRRGHRGRGLKRPPPPRCHGTARVAKNAHKIRGFFNLANPAPARLALVQTLETRLQKPVRVGNAMWRKVFSYGA